MERAARFFGSSRGVGCALVDVWLFGFVRAALSAHREQWNARVRSFRGLTLSLECFPHRDSSHPRLFSTATLFHCDSSLARPLGIRQVLGTTGWKTSSVRSLSVRQMMEHPMNRPPVLSPSVIAPRLALLEAHLLAPPLPLRPTILAPSLRFVWARTARERAFTTASQSTGTVRVGG